MYELPKDSKMKWVPENLAKYYEQLQEHSAWYSGDTSELINFYSTGRHTPFANGRFWGENIMSKDKRTVVHAPIAGDIATFSANMLFSERPDFVIPEAYERNTETKELIKNTRAMEADSRLNEIIDQGGIVDRLLEAGETSASLGGVYLKPTWDTEVADVPILTIAQPDNAIPVFKYGFLVGVIFHKIVMKDAKGKIIRLLEHYKNDGWIENGLYIGDEHTIGHRVPLTYLMETATIQPYINSQIDDIICRYVPNKRPHKRFRGSNLGMSDFQGVETLMDSLDLTMTSWIRDIMLGRGRIHVGDSMLKNDGNGNTSFDAGAEVYVELDVDPSMLGNGTSPITATQFQIRTDEHYKTATELTSKILNMAGYAPQSYGLNLDGGISTQSHEIRERKTLITKQKKERFFKTAIDDTLQIMLMIDNIHLGNKTPTEFRPNTTFADTLGHDLASVVNTVQTLSNARSASIQTRVEMLHPDWTPEEVSGEVSRIREEEGMNVEDPIVIGGKQYDK
jgi:hypothetical protein